MVMGLMSTGAESAGTIATPGDTPSHEQATATWKMRPVGGATPKGPVTTMPEKEATPGEDKEATALVSEPPGCTSSCNCEPL